MNLQAMSMPLDVSAYISVETKEEDKEDISRYFLHLFDPYTPSFVYRNTVKNYYKYYNESTWQVHTKNEPFPQVLFVCHNENAKKHVLHYARALLKKEYEEKFSLYLTTTKIILSGSNTIWEEVK
jgi:hypothetical protein